MNSVIGIGMIGGGVMLLVWLYGNPFVQHADNTGTTPGVNGASGFAPGTTSQSGGGGGGGGSW